MEELVLSPLVSEQQPIQSHSTPLLCWDIANPALVKRVQIAEDIAQVTQLGIEHQWQLELNLRKLLANNYILVVTDKKKNIVWASHDFQTMTGYSLIEAMGRKPSFLQGPKTNPKTIQLVRERLANFEMADSKILNYRKGGEPYWCQVKIYPIQDTNGTFTHFIAVEKELD
jgi:PAS domain S-box-containing protein